MVRLAVTGWLVVATLLGPWLCCCAAAPAADRTPVPTAAAPKPSCCSHKKKAAEPPAKGDPRPDRPHHGDCPCKEGVAKVSVAPTPAEVEFLAPAALIPVGSLIESGTLFPHADRGEGRSLSADVLLHVFHNLRC